MINKRKKPHISVRLCGSYWVRTSDPPDVKSGCFEPAELNFINKLFYHYPAFPGFNLLFTFKRISFVGILFCVFYCPVACFSSKSRMISIMLRKSFRNIFARTDVVFIL